MSKNPVYRCSNSRPNVSEGYEVTSELPGRTPGMFSRTLYAYRSLPSSCQLFFYPDANSILLRAHLCTAVEANSRDSIVVEDCFHGLVILGRRPFPMVTSLPHGAELNNNLPYSSSNIDDTKSDNVQQML